MTAPQWVSAGTYASGTGDVTPGLPAGWAEGHVLLLFVEFEGTDTPTVTAFGWRQIGDTQRTSGTDPVGFAIFWKRAASGETAPTITDTGDHTSAIIHAFSGAAAASPVHAYADDWSGATDTTAWVNDVTTTVNNCLIVNTVAHGIDTASANFTAWTNAALTGLTERSDNSHTSGTGGGIGVATGVLVNAGWSDATQATLAVGSPRAYATIALLPADQLDRPTYKVYIDWDNDGSVLAGAPTTGEDVTARVLNVRTPQRFSYGRDTARSLSAVKPGAITIELNNVSRDYSPDNASSPLYGNLGTGRPVLIRAVHGGNHDLMYGFIDDYVIDPFREKKSVTLTVVDILGRLAATTVSTNCFQSVQTGAAIEAILDAADWPADKRDIDPGSSTLRYWTADGVDAWTAIQEIIVAEGTPSIAYVDPTTGSFVFRDRHHRKLYDASLTSQTTLRDTGAEPLFSSPVEYNVGFRDLINSTDFTVEERAPLSLRPIWATDSTFAVPAGTTTTLKAVLTDPAFGILTPVVDTDYKLLSGAVSITLNRTSGKTIEINLIATSTAYITGMQLRGYPCPVVRNYKVTSTNGDSVSKYGAAFPTDSSYVPKWAGVNDCEAIGDIIVAQRGERLPVMTVTVKNANNARIMEILSRKLGDQVKLVETETSTNHGHYIERIEHGIAQAGKYHEIRLGCERVQVAQNSQFTFDVAGLGFDQGELGPGGFDDPTTLFILDSNTAGHRLDSGKLGT